MKHIPVRLPQGVRQLLAPFFPGFDLGRIRVYEGLPWYVLGKPVGYADRNNIYLADGEYSIDTIEGLSLIAHEITHCRQYNDHGTWRFRALYLKAYFRNRWSGMSRKEAYLKIPFEIEARRIEARVGSALRKKRSQLSKLLMARKIR